MKTVMKKMFSLLLVAVLLVGVMPFQAFADGTVTVNVIVNSTNVSNFPANFDTLSSLEDQAKSYVTDYIGATLTNWTDMDGNVISDSDVQNGWTINANFYAPYCEKCSGYGHETSANHCPYCHWGDGHDATCPHNCNMGYACPSQYHKDGCLYNTCATCGNAKHGTTPCCSECKQLGGNHLETCTSGCTGAASCDSQWHFAHKDGCVSQHVCSVCNTKGHLEKDCSQVIETCCGVQKGSAHRSDCITKCTRAYNCTNANHYDDCEWELCDVEGCEELETEAHTEHTGVRCNANNQCTLWKGHSGKHSYQCPTAGCEYTINHSGNCSNEPEYEEGDSDLVIYVNLHTANVETATKHLITYKNLSEDTLIYDFISDRRDEIRAELVDLYGKDYSWSGHVYDHNNDSDPIDTMAHLGEGTTVYINGYTYQDLVYIYVHDSRSYSNIRVIQLEGKQVGDTVSRSEVVDAVNDYYTLSSLKMYSDDDWEKYVQGKDVDAVSDLKVTHDPFRIDVRITGSSKSGSGYTADSSNPKTGDAIFAPMIVLGASVSALAVLFYLNKKRAY